MSESWRSRSDQRRAATEDRGVGVGAEPSFRGDVKNEIRSRRECRRRVAPAFAFFHMNAGRAKVRAGR
jgi:hypothetical protein